MLEFKLGLMLPKVFEPKLPLKLILGSILSFWFRIFLSCFAEQARSPCMLLHSEILALACLL